VDYRGKLEEDFHLSKYLPKSVVVAVACVAQTGDFILLKSERIFSTAFSVSCVASLHVALNSGSTKS
jgi:hypothetical protein